MKEYKKIRLGVAPTRRDFYPPKENAIENKKKMLKRLNEIFASIPDLEVFDLEDVLEDGLLFEERDVEKASEYFIANKVDALFIPHANFGQEEAVAKLAYKMNLPVLIWGPRDGSVKKDTPFRELDTHCGPFCFNKSSFAIWCNIYICREFLAGFYSN